MITDADPAAEALRPLWALASSDRRGLIRYIGRRATPYPPTYVAEVGGLHRVLHPDDAWWWTCGVADARRVTLPDLDVDDLPETLDPDEAAARLGMSRDWVVAQIIGGGLDVVYFPHPQSRPRRRLFAAQVDAKAHPWSGPRQAEWFRVQDLFGLGRLLADDLPPPQRLSAGGSRLTEMHRRLGVLMDAHERGLLAYHRLYEVDDPRRGPGRVAFHVTTGGRDRELPEAGVLAYVQGVEDAQGRPTPARPGGRRSGLV